MSYQSIVIMAGSQSLRARMVAAAAAAGSEDPVGFVDRNMWQLVSDDGLADKWDEAVAKNDINKNPDTGARTDVITDAKIRKAIEGRMAELAATGDSGGASEPPTSPTVAAYQPPDAT